MFSSRSQIPLHGRSEETTGVNVLPIPLWKTYQECAAFISACFSFFFSLFFFLSFILSCFFSNRHIQSHLSGSVIKTSRLNSPRRCECHLTSRTLPRRHHHPIHTQISAAAGRDSVLMRPRSGHDPAHTPFPCAAAV